MFINSKFTIDGIASTDIGVNGVILVRTDNGPVVEQVIGTRQIIQDKNIKNLAPTFYGVMQDNIEFDLKLLFKDMSKFTENNFKEIHKLFGGLKHIPFISDEYPDIIFYVLATGISIVKYGDYKGWIEMHLVTNAPHAYTNDTTIEFDLSAIEIPTVIEVTNPSNVMNPKYIDYIYEPKMIVELSGETTNFTLTNLSNDNDIFGFTDLEAGEMLVIDNNLKRINTSSIATRIDKLINKNWLGLIYGMNQIEVNNPVIITFMWQFPIYV